MYIKYNNRGIKDLWKDKNQCQSHSTYYCATAWGYLFVKVWMLNTVTVLRLAAALSRSGSPVHECLWKLKLKIVMKNWSLKAWKGEFTVDAWSYGSGADSPEANPSSVGHCSSTWSWSLRCAVPLTQLLLKSVGNGLSVWMKFPPISQNPGKF